MTQNISDDIDYFLKKQLTGTSSFDEIEFCYQQLCRILLDSQRDISKYNGKYTSQCPNNFILSIFYLTMPKTNRDVLINDLSDIMNTLRYNETYLEAIENPFVSEFYQNNNITESLLYLNDKQVEILYSYYNELLN